MFIAVIFCSPLQISRWWPRGPVIVSALYACDGGVTGSQVCADTSQTTRANNEREVYTYDLIKTPVRETMNTLIDPKD